MNAVGLENRNAVVTGGARGFGLAIAQRFLRQGAKVCLWDIDAEELEAAANSLNSGDRVTHVEVDISDAAAVENAAAKTFKSFDDVQILVNNAGITGPNAKTWEYPPDQFRRVIEVDLFSVFLCCKAFIPGMILGKYGRIINVASVAGKEGNPNASAYSAAKAGVIGLTKSMGKELAISGVTVNCITPAAAKTDIFKQMSQEHIDYMLSKIPMGRFLALDELSAMVAWLASEECSFSTGAVFDISGGRSTY